MPRSGSGGASRGGGEGGGKGEECGGLRAYVGEIHLARVDLENVAACLLVRRGKFDLAINAPRADECGVKALNLVGREDDLDVGARIEAVKLVEQLEHRALDLLLAAAAAVVSLGADRVDLVDEDDGRRLLVGDAEELAHELGAIAEVLLDELRAGHAQKGG